MALGKHEMGAIVERLDWMESKIRNALTEMWMDDVLSEVVMPPLTKKDPGQKYIDDADRAIKQAQKGKKQAKLKQLLGKVQKVRNDATTPFHIK